MEQGFRNIAAVTGNNTYIWKISGKIQVNIVIKCENVYNICNNYDQVIILGYTNVHDNVMPGLYRTGGKYGKRMECKNNRIGSICT